jgi:hypothetical protein
MIHGGIVLVQKDSNTKNRNLLLHGTLKNVYQVYHSKQEMQKRKSKFFYPDNFVLP